MSSRLPCPPSLPGSITITGGAQCPCARTSRSQSITVPFMLLPDEGGTRAEGRPVQSKASQRWLQASLWRILCSQDDRGVKGLFSLG